MKCVNGGEAASWFSGIARQCAPGPQGRPHRPSFAIPLVVGRRRRSIDRLLIGQTDSNKAKRGGGDHCPVDGEGMTSMTGII